MRIFHCNGCGKDTKYANNESLIICICGSGDVFRKCLKCGSKYDYTEQEECRHCRAIKLAQQVVTGEIGLVDAFLQA